jgi:hypothetical protein
MNAPLMERPSLPLPTPMSTSMSPLPSLSRPAPGWLRNLLAVRDHYEERFGWPVTVRIAQRQVAVALGKVADAVTMPAALAAQVHTHLGMALLAGPVIGHARGGRWTFLTQPVAPAGDDFLDRLAEHDVRHAGAGAYTVVPADHGDAGWRWITAPRPHHPLPSAYAVVAMVRRLCAAGPTP